MNLQEFWFVADDVSADVQANKKSRYFVPVLEGRAILMRGECPAEPR